MRMLYGKPVAREVEKRVQEKVRWLKEKEITPNLSVILVGKDPASEVYVRKKKDKCEELGIASQVYRLADTVTQTELLEKIIRLNRDNSVHGILVQLPLPKQIDPNIIIEAIDPKKDVDGFHPLNVGKHLLGELSFLSCTPAGIIQMLDYYRIPIEGKVCTVIGRSNIVGKPMASLLLQRDGTVIQCHSKTRNLQEMTSRADILICAAGQPRMITEEYIKPGAVVIDVGIHRMPDGTLCGDVDEASALNKVSAISPVPGGVGPMTIAMLMENTVKAAEQRVKDTQAYSQL